MLHERCDSDGLRHLVLDAGRGNALGSELLGRLETAFDPSGTVGPVVLSARGRSFCTGLDRVEAGGLDRAGMAELMDRFHRALRAVLLWPAPVVAALQGHALAGGALLALCADRRVLAHGEARFGVHGVQLGVVYPQIAIEVVRWRLDRTRAEELLYAGRLRPGHEALRAGLVDELVDAAALAGRAAELARSLPAPDEAVRRPVAGRTARIDDAGRRTWLDHWFSPATRRRVLGARDALVARQGVRPGEPRP